MNRSFRAVSGIALAVLVITCTDRNLNGPLARGRVGLNLSAFSAGVSGGQAPIPIDSVTVSLISLDGSPGYDTAFAFGGAAYTQDSMIVGLLVPLQHSSEVFQLGVTVKGQGYTWFTASDTVTIVPGQNSTPPLSAKFVGPGHNAGLLFIGPQDSTVVPGLPVLLYASVSDSLEAPLTGVPVGFRLQNPALGIISYPTYLTPVLIPQNTGTTVDTTWLIGETPNHTVDSTQIYVTPQTGGGAPAQIFLTSGDGQVANPNTVLPLPLTTLVTDANHVPVGLAKVVWARTGLGSFVSPDTTVADNLGFARMTYKLGNGIGTDTITASLVGTFAGPPPSVTFTARADTGLALRFDTTTYLLGKSQVSYAILVRTKIPVAATLTVQIGRSDSTAPPTSQTFGLLTTSVVIPAGDTLGCCVQVTGNNLGSATLIGHASGYPDATANVIVTTPRLVVDSPVVAYNGLVATPIVMEVADSTGAIHYTAADVVVRDSSSDSTIAKADSAAYTIVAGNFYTLANIIGVTPGSTLVTFRAPGYAPAVTQVTVDTALVFVYAGGGYAAGLGQTTTDNYVSLPGLARAPIVVSLSSSDPKVFTVPATLTIPTDSVLVTFPITGTGLGQATLTVRAAGMFVSDSVQVLTVSTPLIQPVVAATVARGVKTEVYVYAEDTLGFRSGNVTAPLTVTLSTTDGNAVWDSTHLTIQTGTGLDSVGVTFNSTGQFSVSAAAAGYTTGSTLTNSAAPPIGGSAMKAVIAPMRIRVVPMYPDSLRRRVSPTVRSRPAPPRR